MNLFILIQICDHMPGSLIFTTRAEAVAYADPLYQALWEELSPGTPYPGYDEAHSIFTGEDIRDDDLIWIEDHTLPRDPEEAFGCVYNYADLAVSIDGYDPALHRAALEEWVNFEKNSTESAMSDVVWVDFPFEVEMLTDPGAYWRWDNATDDYDTWAEEQRK